MKQGTIEGELDSLNVHLEIEECYASYELSSWLNTEDMFDFTMEARHSPDSLFHELSISFIFNPGRKMCVVFEVFMPSECGYTDLDEQLITRESDGNGGWYYHHQIEPNQ